MVEKFLEQRQAVAMCCCVESVSAAYDSLAVLHNVQSYGLIDSIRSSGAVATEGKSQPGVADSELEPVRVSGASIHHILEGTLPDMAGRRKPLHTPSAVSRLVDIDAPKSALWAPANDSLEYRWQSC